MEKEHNLPDLSEKGWLFGSQACTPQGNYKFFFIFFEDECPCPNLGYLSCLDG